MPKSIREIMDIGLDEFLSMPVRDLRKAVSQLSSAANKRLKRLQKSDLLSPAMIEAQETGGKFGTKGKSEIELQIEFRRVSNFLQSQSSTVTGARQLLEETRSALSDTFGIGIDKADFNELIQGYKQIMEESPDFQSRALRYKYLREFNLKLSDNTMTTVELSEDIVSILNRYYQPGGAQYDGTAKYFEFT